jgi:hypothetical protein
MLKVISDHTGRPEPCTIQTGVVGCDGVRRGAMADIDCYAMFRYEDDAGRDVDVLEVYQISKIRKYRPEHLNSPGDADIEAMQAQVALGLPVGRF